MSRGLVAQAAIVLALEPWRRTVRKLAQWLEEHQMSAPQLADRLGVSRQAVYPWLDGRSRPSAEVLARLEELTRGEITARAFVTADGEVGQ